MTDIFSRAGTSPDARKLMRDIHAITRIDRALRLLDIAPQPGAAGSWRRAGECLRDMRPGVSPENSGCP